MIKPSLISLSLTCLLAVAACQTPPKQGSEQVPIAGLIAMRPKIDVRTTRTTLAGKSMKEVVKIIGQPTTAYTIDDREIWNYDNSARDSITGRPVKLVEVVFKKRVVQSVNFSL